jgi:hypothetical protein
MESVIDLLKSLQLNMLEVTMAGLAFFFFGYLFGAIKAKRLTREIYGLQKDVLDLNEELLYGTTVSETPVIGLKTETLKQAKLAK